MTIPLILAGLAVTFALTGAQLLRKSTGKTTAIATIVLLLATACAYISTRLFMESPRPASGFVLHDNSGIFQPVAAGQLQSALTAAAGRPVLLEFYADWCTSCVAWKKNVFSRRDVQQAMMPLVLLQIDASNLTPDVQSLMDRHGLSGLPALLVYDRKGIEHPELRLLGEMPATDFIHWINNRLLPTM